MGRKQQASRARKKRHQEHENFSQNPGQMSEDLSKIMLHLVMIERRGKPVRAHPSVRGGS